MGLKCFEVVFSDVVNAIYVKSVEGMPFISNAMVIHIKDCS
jgi:hypothetical protein